jgi:hypothetical protein
MRCIAFQAKGFLIFLCLTTIACTHIMHVPYAAVSNYPDIEKINLNVGLAILPELSEAKWEYHHMGDTWLMPLGENLTQHSEEMVKKLFSSVRVEKKLTANTIRGVDITIIPKMKAFEGSSGAFAWSDAVATIVMEWTILDSRNNILFADTIRADATSKLGVSFAQQSRGEERTEEAIESVFRDSFVSISKSSEIRKFVPKK